MSNFIAKLKNPKTGRMTDAFCIDNYFGNGIYGYGLRKDGEDADWEDSMSEFGKCDFYKEEEII
jgi:hypothetical protein